jgi:hypothetical protein
VTSQEIAEQVAKATGESLREIRRRGFSLADSPHVAFDPEPYDIPPQLVDWDELARRRVGLFP